MGTKEGNGHQTNAVLLVIEILFSGENFQIKFWTVAGLGFGFFIHKTQSYTSNMRRSRRATKPSFSLPLHIKQGFLELVAEHVESVASMLESSLSSTEPDTVVDELERLMGMNNLSPAEFLARFFNEDMMSEYLSKVGKSSKGSAPVLSSRITSYWESSGFRKRASSSNDTAGAPPAKKSKASFDKEQHSIQTISNQNTSYEKERQVVLQAVRKACVVTRAVQAEMLTGDIVTKADSSPVTVADFASQAVVNCALEQAFPQDLIVAEEDSKQLTLPEEQGTLANVVKHVNSVSREKGTISKEEIIRLIDLGSASKTHPANEGSRRWTLDPIDGTKGFIRKVLTSEPISAYPFVYSEA